MLQDEDVQALTSVGLSVLQAKVYLALVKSGEATVKAISKASEVARQDIYRITSELQKYGLVEKIIATPNEFKAIPLTEGVHILLQRLSEERAESHKKVMKLMQRHKDNNVKANLQEEKTQFILVPEKDVSLRIGRAIKNAQTSVDTITTLNRFRLGVSDFDKMVKKALKKGVKFRTVTDKPEDENSLIEIAKALVKDPLFKIRYDNHAFSAVLGIYDKKEVIISVSATRGWGETSALLSKNLCLLAIAQNYFEVTWSTALEFKPERP